MALSKKLFAAAALVPFLAACGGAQEVSAPRTTLDLPAETTTTTATAAAGPSAPIDVNASISDPEFGSAIKATKVVRNFPVPEKFAIRARTAELVLVNLEVTTGSKYATSVGESSTRLVGSTGTAGTATTSIVATEMAAAGYPPLKDVSGQNKTGSGWVAYFVEPKGSDKLTLRQIRNAAKVLGSEQTIPRKEFDAPLL